MVPFSALDFNLYTGLLKRRRSAAALDLFSSSNRTYRHANAVNFPFKNLKCSRDHFLLETFAEINYVLNAEIMQILDLHTLSICRLQTVAKSPNFYLKKIRKNFYLVLFSVLLPLR